MGEERYGVSEIMWRIVSVISNKLMGEALMSLPARQALGLVWVLAEILCYIHGWKADGSAQSVLFCHSRGQPLLYHRDGPKLQEARSLMPAPVLHQDTH